MHMGTSVHSLTSKELYESAKNLTKVPSRLDQRLAFETECSTRSALPTLSTERLHGSKYFGASIIQYIKHPAFQKCLGSGSWNLTGCV